MSDPAVGAEGKRKERRFGAVDSWWLDIKLGGRMLIKYPGLTVVGAFGIAMAVAIATGGFSVIYGSFLAPSLPLEEGDRIVSLQIWDSAANRPERRIVHEYQVWREELKSVQEIAAFRPVTLNLIAAGARPESVRAAAMSASGFRVARVAPSMGRVLSEEDEREGAPSVVVISESVWRNRYAGDPSILGRTIQLGNTVHSVVGVMPDSFAFPVNHRFWVPLRVGATPAQPLTGPDLLVFGRLAPDATIGSGQAELETIWRRAAIASSNTHAQLRPHVLPYTAPFLGIHQRKDVTGLHMMNGVIVVLLVLVCLNVAILVYTRTAMRQAEISVRTALGASRGRIVSQFFVEALVLSGVGTLGGLAIAELALRYAASATLSVASELPFWLSFDLSGEASLYAAVLSLVAAAIVGVLPALRATRHGVRTGARVIGSDGSGMRLGGTWTALVIAQVGFAVALLPGAVFAAWENLRAELADPGVAANEFLTAQLGMDSVRESEASRYAGNVDELMRRVAAEPRVGSVTFSTAFPGDEPGAVIEAAEGASGHEVRVNNVNVDFFRALEVPVLAGRGFERDDVVSAVVVNQSLALRVFAGDAIGRRIRYAPRNGVAESGSRWYEIVGIVRDFPAGVSPGMLDSPLKLYHAVAATQMEPVTIAVRVQGGDLAALARRLPEIAASVDPDLHLRGIMSLDKGLRKEQWLRRMEAAVLGGVSVSVLLLSSAGIYALMSFAVSQRRKEIGIRMALGADRTRLVASIFSRALGPLAVGAGLGAALAVALQTTTVIVLGLIAVFMMGVGFLAALGPARRCLSIEPTEALREN